VVDGTALASNDWTLTARAPDGEAIRQTGRSTVVMRQQRDGGWRMLIDKP
jgi:ketosteroid isomerase-like protein